MSTMAARVQQGNEMNTLCQQLLQCSMTDEWGVVSNQLGDFEHTQIVHRDIRPNPKIRPLEFWFEDSQVAITNQQAYVGTTMQSMGCNIFSEEHIIKANKE